MTRRLPVTVVLFGVGAIAIVGLPPLNGFVSEWALFQVLVQAGSHAPAVLGLAMPIAVGVVALTAGLAAATFVKVIGTGMLALPRSNAAEHAVESPAPMLAGMAVLASGCLALGLFPWLVASGLARGRYGPREAPPARSATVLRNCASPECAASSLPCSSRSRCSRE